ncbi:MAG: ABC transporter permease [Eubacteriales bacterium]|nr:ABC transporter permease [Eubacteriales bacterium]
MKRKKSAAAYLLLALALLLTGAGLWFTAIGEDLLEYVLLAPADEKEIIQLAEKKEDALEEMSDVLRASTVSGRAKGVHVSSADSADGAQAALHAGGEGFFEVYPKYLISGRLISETELRTGAPKALLDEELAFKLFPTVDPIGRKISVSGVELEVVGVVRHSRRVGETELYNVYAPLPAMSGVPFETLSLSAVPLPGSGAHIMFETIASDSWRAGGYFYRMEKEALRARLPVLYIGAIFAFAGVLWLVRKVNGLVLAFIGDIRARLQSSYAAKLLPRILSGILGLLLLYAALGCAAWFIGLQAVEPLYIFPEWVPENLVQWASIRKVFWNLATAASQQVNVASGDVRALQFWGGVIRWGVLFGLSGVVLLAHGRRKED